MALNVAQGNFISTASGTTQSISGLGFTPIAIMFVAVDGSSTSSSGVASSSFSIGFTDGTNNKSSQWVGANGVSTSNVLSLYSTNRCISEGGPLALVTMDIDGFTVTWDSAPGATREIYYIAFGGSGLTAIVGQDTMKTTAGTKATSGLGFKPDVIFLISSSTLNVDASNLQGAFSFGCAVSATKRWALASNVQNGQTMSANVNGVSIQQSTKCLEGLTTGAAVEYEADLSSMDASGFTLNYTTAPASAYPFAYLAISGGQWDCGTSVAPASATTQIVSGMAFQPTGLLLAMAGLTTLNSITSNAIEAIGLTTSSSSRSEIGIFHNDAINTVEQTINETTKVLRHPNTTTNVADFTSFNIDGWTITWSVDTVAYQVGWVAMASTTGATPLTQVSADDLNADFGF